MPGPVQDTDGSPVAIHHLRIHADPQSD